MKDTETKTRFVELRAQGLSFAKIAEEIGVSKQSLIAWSKDLRLEIENLKQIELEALREKYYLTTKKRLELFGEKLEAVKTELDRRSFEDVPTDKLFDILLKLEKALGHERKTIQFITEGIDFDMGFTTWSG